MQVQKQLFGSAERFTATKQLDPPYYDVPSGFKQQPHSRNKTMGGKRFMTATTIPNVGPGSYQINGMAEDFNKRKLLFKPSV